jgi:prevent-host-death family protein
MNWQLAEAKNRFSEVVRRALLDQPQRITRRNDSVIVISEKEYERLLGKQVSLVDYLMSAPSLDELDLERDKSPMRDVEL